MSTTTNNNITIYQPSALSPYKSCIDMAYDQAFTAVVNGEKFDYYRLLMKKMDDNTVVYDTGNAVQIPETSSSIQHTGSWQYSTQDVTRIDDTDTSVFYSGSWSSDRNDICYGHTCHTSNINGDYVQIEFSGSAFRVYVVYTANNAGYFDLYVDGQRTLDTQGSMLTQTADTTGALFIVSGLQNTTHTIKLVVASAPSNPTFFGWCRFDYLEVDNSDSNYVPFMFSNTPNDYITYNFTGSGINCYFETSPDSGIVDILIDGVDMGNIDLYSVTNVQDSLMYSNLNLSSGSHTIKIVITGNNNGSSLDYYANFEYFELVNKTALPTILYNGQQFSLTIPANAVSYRGILKWQLWLWNSANSGEYITSYEMPFENMTTPTINFNVTSPIASKSNTFNATYSQAEEIGVARWDMQLYSVNYDVNCGHFGQKVNGQVINAGTFEDSTTPDGIHIDCGTF